MRGYEHLTRCRVCKCTEMEPCCPPCAWEPGEPDLCDNCARIIRAVRNWLEAGLRPSWAALLKEAKKGRGPGEHTKRRRAAGAR